VVTMRLILCMRFGGKGVTVEPRQLTSIAVTDTLVEVQKIGLRAKSREQGRDNIIKNDTNYSKWFSKHGFMAELCHKTIGLFQEMNDGVFF